MKKNLLLLLTLSCFAQFSFAQNKVVKGSVLDTSGYPIIGATIKIVGSNQATVTDMDGNFTIQDVNPKATINVSYIGMQPQTLKVTDNLKVVLNDDFQNLNDVVVIGYGSAKAKDLTSPITVIKADDIKSTPSSSPMSALQGKVAGVNVVNSGTPVLVLQCVSVESVLSETVLRSMLLMVCSMMTSTSSTMMICRI